ncbi:response regulator [Paenibacillus sp. GCM10023252]|uniref:response regulator n=1 Tax=Paenibacillus sp. GCM10023252 TaxID=3252649 RepID=UPI003609F3E2
MIDALIVDDEYFVRKGLIHMVPWESHDIQIVGEAANGEKALEFLEEHPSVGLLITDLTMPIMPGFELIKEVKRRYPEVTIVVLTCHQDFHYAQEAIRLGAIDYIVKTELEDASLDHSIARISTRMKEENRRTARDIPLAPAEPWGIFFLSLGAEEAEKLREEKLLPLMSSEESVTVIGRKALLLEGARLKQPSITREAVLHTVNTAAWLPAVIHGMGAAPQQTLMNLFSELYEKRLYYEYRFDVSVLELTWKEIQHPLASSGSMDMLEYNWKRFDWVYDDDAFRAWTEQVRIVKPPMDSWTALLLGTVSAWRHLPLMASLQEWPHPRQGFSFWEQWMQWLSEIRKLFRSEELSQEVCLGLIRSIQMMMDEMSDGVGQTELSRKVNINRSYFSHCFKQFSSISFHELYNLLRIDRAMTLLQETNQPIYMISEAVGFQDDKYFSKFFRQQTGRLPREVRLGGQLTTKDDPTSN